MMTREKMMEVLEGLGSDVSLWDKEDYCFDVTIKDFEGFDEDGSELDREYDDPKAVERFEEMLETECLFQEGDFYVIYHFEGFDVRLGYASFDI